MSYKPEPTALSYEDRIRMQRLSLEIAERAHEIGRRLANTLAIKDALPLSGFTLSAGPQSTDAADEWDVDYYTEGTFSDGSKVCYDPFEKVCYPGPCPE